MFNLKLYSEGGLIFLFLCMTGCFQVEGLNRATYYDPLRFDNTSATLNSISVIPADQYEAHLTKLNEAIKGNEKDYIALYRRAMLYTKSGKYDAAKEDLTTVLSQADDGFQVGTVRLADIYVKRGLICWETGNVDQAITDLSKAIELEPNHWEAYFHRWQAYLFKGDTEKANQDRERGMILKPKFFEIEYSYKSGMI